MSASAFVSYGTGGATSGVSATATATLGGDSVTATAGDAGSSGPQSKDGYHVVQASVSGGVAKVPMSGSVSVDSSDSLKYHAWVDSAAGPGSTGPGTYYYSGAANGYTSASDSATASAYPVTLNLSGTVTNSSGDNILIGQGCIGYLSSGPATLSDFHWDPSGDTFDGFDVAPDLSTGHVVLLSSDTWTQPNPLWHYSKDSNGSTITVKCSATASVNGTVIGTVQAQRDVQVWAPYYAFKNMAGPVSVNNIEGYLEAYAGGPPVGGAGSGDWDPPGMKNGGRVGTPDLFLSAGAGVWQFIQLIHPGRWIYYIDDTGNLVTDPLNFNGLQMLDNECPYPNSDDSPAPPWPADSANPPPAGSTVTTYWMEDSPGDELLDSYSRFRADESFDDYMMYEPPDSGDGSEWVPLHLFHWKWQADVSRTGASWVSGWTPSPPGYVSNLSSNRCTTHPFWQSRLTNGAMHF